MFKQNLSTHDIFVLTQELQQFVGSRVLNIYDISNQSICIKLNYNSNEKKYLLIESSSKLYLLNNFSSIKNFPSSFTMKLRKHLANKRINSIIQLNSDRVIDIHFGSDEFKFHLICEFYASGNIILTDKDYNILTLLHTYAYSQNNQVQAKVSVNSVYPIQLATNQINLNTHDVKTWLQNTIAKLDKKIKLKQFVCKLPWVSYSPDVLTHCLILNQINPNTKIDSNTDILNIFTDDKINLITQCIQQLYLLDNSNLSSNITFSGYYSDSNFIPYIYLQYESVYKSENYVKTEKFIDAISIYFNKLQPIETKQTIKEKERIIKKTKELKIIENIQLQIDSIQNKINGNLESVDNIIFNIDYITQFINSFVKSSGYGYIYFTDIELIENLLYKYAVKFKYNGFTYLFDTNKSIHENINQIYKLNKNLKIKLDSAKNILDSTVTKQNKLYKSNKLNKSNELQEQVEQVGQEQVEQVGQEQEQTNIKIKGKKKDLWFEQFNWFISSDQLLVISGKTADQNELIVKKYFGPTDIYIHSDVFGSGSCVIKNKSDSKENALDIGLNYPKTIEEAGQFLISHTRAWGTGVPDKAYWVRFNQVSKTPESGEFISKGSFIIRGEKNYINVDKFELGFGILFKVSNSDKFIETIDSNSDQIIEYAVPIVGPYSSQSKYKFKIKFIPGNQKTKKILPQIFSSFYKKSNLYEKISIKQISNDSIQKVLINGIKFFI